MFGHFFKSTVVATIILGLTYLSLANAAEPSSTCEFTVEKNERAQRDLVFVLGTSQVFSTDSSSTQTIIAVLTSNEARRNKGYSIEKLPSAAGLLRFRVYEQYIDSLGDLFEKTAVSHTLEMSSANEKDGASFGYYKLTISCRF